ncbi:hypothetical protein NECAME_10502 [Necator americanus]|uniref:Receptor ligand binding region domain-containing protein n=1 Tax=Necator americanus TaxID=51031 RepID=W2TAZ0_NECAM|nr:hypothetical protein NECAME_10502 [Necator americanus]ETN78182.1 hypothetical protein NECAME_10502 [Necator americanus]
MEQTIAFLREGVAQCSCCQTPGCNKKSVPVVAIVGPGKSSATIAVQNLLQVFRIPQIGYSATTPDLSDKEQFGYFMRVVPSDVWQAQAINRLLHHYNWTYIAVLYSAGNYGEKGFEALERLVNQKNSVVCVAYSEKIKSLASEAEYKNVLKSLASQKLRPQVVVCFCEGLTIRNFFQAQKELIKKNKSFKRFQWIGSDGWADRNDVVEGLENEAEGSFSIRIHAPKVPGFRAYYSQLNPENNTVNPWFREFWQQKFGCQFAVSKEDKNNENIRICTGNEDLDKEYKEDPKLSQVINSIRVVAFGLKAMYQDRCRDNSTLCTEMLSRNGTLLYQYLLNVTYEDQFKQSIYFDSNGDPPAWNYGVLCCNVFDFGQAILNFLFFDQVVITWILVGIQSVIVAVGVLQEWPSAGFSSHYLPHRSSTKSSSLAGAGVTRTASVHVPVTTGKGKYRFLENPFFPFIGGKFVRSFSIVGKKKPIPLDEDVAQLVEACRRYQDEKLCATAANLLLEEQEDEVGALLADSIENSVRTVLSTVAGGPRPTVTKASTPQRMSLTPTFIESVTKSSAPASHAPVPKPPRSRPRQKKPPTIEEDGFEELVHQEDMSVLFEDRKLLLLFEMRMTA